MFSKHLMHLNLDVAHWYSPRTAPPSRLNSVVTTERGAELLDAHSGAVVRQLTAPDIGKVVLLVAVAFTSDPSEIIGVYAGGTNVVWNASSGEILRAFRLPGQSMSTDSSAPSEDRTLMAGSGRTNSKPNFVVWSVKTGQLLCKLEPLAVEKRRFAISPDNKLLAFNVESNLTVVSLTTGTELVTFRAVIQKRLNNAT